MSPPPTHQQPQSTKPRAAAAAATTKLPLVLVVVGLSVLCGPRLLVSVNQRNREAGELTGAQHVRGVRPEAMANESDTASAAALALASASPSAAPTIIQGGGTISTRLRLDWTSLEPLSAMARYWRSHQTNCTLRRVQFHFPNLYGLGSELHLWTQALCNSAEHGVRFRTVVPWNYRDSEACAQKDVQVDAETGDEEEQQQQQQPESESEYESALRCYFPRAEPDCRDDNTTAARSEWRNRSSPVFFYGADPAYVEVLRECPNVMGMLDATMSDVRASAIEYLFSGVSSVVVNEANRQLNVLYGAVADPESFGTFITVHVRWGDKPAEAPNTPIDKYVSAVQTLVAESQTADQSSAAPTKGEKVGIYLSTEDPLAVEQFQEEAAKHNWTVFVDVYQQEFSSVRDDGYNGNPHLAANFKGRPGLVALGSLLVAMQANYFVLTSTSNWSRLMNELRKNVLDPRCDNCTRMIDLSEYPFEW